MTGRKGIFLECLEKSRPDVRKISVLGEQYDNRCPNEKSCGRCFVRNAKYGILWRMEQIITASKEPYQNEQLCLFRQQNREDASDASSSFFRIDSLAQSAFAGIGIPTLDEVADGNPIKAIII